MITLDYRTGFLEWLGNRFTFDMRGDQHVFASSNSSIKISCVINFYGRLDLLSGILHSLKHQDLSTDQFEVILVEDQAGTDEGRAFCESFSSSFNVLYQPLAKNFGQMGYSRNFGLSLAQGELVLFLDDDTVLLQEDFLSTMLKMFKNIPAIDAVIPHGRASFALIEGRYDFHDPYFMTSRCMAYRRSVLKELAGFMSEFVGQEDVEYVIRFKLAGKKAIKTSDLEYFHPPLLVPNSNKAKAVGASFYRLKNRYPTFLWLLLLINCCRHAPLLLLPVRHCKEMGRFGWGAVKGIWACFTKNTDFKYS